MAPLTVNLVFGFFFTTIVLRFLILPSQSSQFHREFQTHASDSMYRVGWVSQSPIFIRKQDSSTKNLHDLSHFSLSFIIYHIIYWPYYTRLQTFSKNTTCNNVTSFVQWLIFKMCAKTKPWHSSNYLSNQGGSE